MAYKKCEWNPDALRALVDASGMACEVVAKNCGISLASLYHYYRGIQMPSMTAMLKIADYFAVPLDYLTGRCTLEQAEAIQKDYAAHFMVLRRAPWEDYLIARRNMPEQYIGYTYEAPWPYNLLDDVFGAKIYGKREREEDFWDEVISEDQMNGLNEAVASMTDREQEAIKAYYQDGLNLDGVGKRFNVTRERARQILAKAVRKLRHPSRSKLIRYGAVGINLESEVKKRKAEIERQLAELEEMEQSIYSRRILADIASKECDARDKRLEGRGWKPHTSENGEPMSINDITIEEMDLSVRSFNCLKRAGANNLGQLIECMEAGDLIRVRNLGRKSMIELCEKVKVLTGRDYKEVYGL